MGKFYYKIPNKEGREWGWHGNRTTRKHQNTETEQKITLEEFRFVRNSRKSLKSSVLLRVFRIFFIRFPIFIIEWFPLLFGWFPHIFWSVSDFYQNFKFLICYRIPQIFGPFPYIFDQLLLFNVPKKYYSLLFWFV